MTKIFIQLSLILVLLSNGNYVNTDQVLLIDPKNKIIHYAYKTFGCNQRLTDADIELLKKAMGVYNDG